MCVCVCMCVWLCVSAFVFVCVCVCVCVHWVSRLVCARAFRACAHALAPVFVCVYVHVYCARACIS